MIELWLTSEDSGIYGRDIGKSLPELCWEILAVLKPHNMLKIGMTNPPYILEHTQEMAAILSHPQVYSHMHIPVQSGSNAVLDAMVREYNIEDFELLCDYLIENVPGITIATDIICGFPGETDSDFDKTVELVKKYKFPSVFISQFYPRPGTVAANMKKLDTKIVKRRSTEIAKVFESYRTYDSLLGTIQKVWITELESNKKNVGSRNTTGEVMVGHTKTYAKVIFKEVETRLLGKCVKAKIVETQKWHVVGVVMETENVIGEIPPVATYRKEFKKTKVSFLARERMNRLKKKLNKTNPLSNKPAEKEVVEQMHVREERQTNWLMRIAVIVGVLLVVIGAIMTFLEK